MPWAGDVERDFGVDREHGADQVGPFREGDERDSRRCVRRGRRDLAQVEQNLALATDLAEPTVLGEGERRLVVGPDTTPELAGSTCSRVLRDRRQQRAAHAATAQVRQHANRRVVGAGQR